MPPLISASDASSYTFCPRPEISKSRRALLLELERIMGLVQTNQGNAFHYPLRQYEPFGKERKYSTVPHELPDERLFWLAYQFGANFFYPFEALNDMLEHLVKRGWKPPSAEA